MCSDRSAHSSNFRFTELWLCCLPCFSCRRLASHLWKIFARSMAVKDFRSACSSQDSRFGTTWFPSSFARNTIASSSAPSANFSWLTAFSVPMSARPTLSIAFARPFRSWVTWWDNGFAEHGNGFCLGLSVSVLIGRDREYRINYLWAVKRLISCNDMPYLVAKAEKGAPRRSCRCYSTYHAHWSRGALYVWQNRNRLPKCTFHLAKVPRMDI